MGCLSAPFKLLGSLGLVVLLAIGWLYRDRLADELHRLLGTGLTPGETVTSGRPGSRALLSARSKIDSLNGWRADSVILTPSEVASMIGVGLDPSVRSQLDSLEVQLLDGSIGVSALLSTARLPRELTGPLAVALRPKERIEAAGPLRVVQPRQAEWAVHSFRIRNFPIPRDAVPKLVSRALGDSSRSTVPIRIPAGIREIRIRPSGATLVGAPRP
ncbi:MAG: hypothetical protein QOK27_1339 [Gemmatimonadales bacterium]|jgi:hypothetical protein|nr:hypothetical protein [Gemmatimonadales bacterium]